MVKKVLRQALMLVCSITMLAQPVTALTEDNVVRNEIFTIESDSHSETVAALLAFGVLSDEDVLRDADSLVRREDIIDILVNYIGLSDFESDKSKTFFTDIDLSDKKIASYNYLGMMGYISGDEAKKFHPNDFLTYNEALACTVNAIDYGIFVNHNKPYPEKYISVAARAKLMNGLQGFGNSFITFRDLCKMLDNGLKAGAAEYIYGGKGEAYISQEITVMEQHLGIKFMDAIVTGNENTRINNYDSKGIGQFDIELNGNVYSTGKKEFANYLGQYVRAYWTNENGEKKIIHMEKKRGSSESISADKIISDLCNNGSVVYENENKRQCRIILDQSELSVIYNGKFLSLYGQLNDVLPDKEGYIYAVDNDSDGMAEVLFVYEYKNYVVGSVDVHSGVITDKISNEKITFDPDKDEVRVYNSNDEWMKFVDIASGDVISVMISAQPSDYQLIIIKVAEAAKFAFDGVISSAKKKDKFSVYGIDDSYVEASARMEDYISQGLLSDDVLGRKLHFYTDVNNRIVYYKYSDDDSWRYGVVSAVGNIKFRSFQVKIFNQDGEWQTVDTASRTVIDGAPADGEELKKKIPIGQIIRYKLKEGELKYIDTVKINSGNSERSDDGGNLNLIASGSGMVHRSGICHMYDDRNVDLAASSKKFVLSANTLIFGIPEKDNLNDEELYYVTRNLKDGYYNSWVPNEESCTIIKDGFESYNLRNEDINIAECVLLKGITREGMGLSFASSFGVITGFKCGNDKKGLEHDIVELSQGTNAIRLYVDDEITYYRGNGAWGARSIVPLADIGLKVGDIIQFGVRNEEYLSSVNVVYRMDQSDSRRIEAWVTNPSYGMSFGGANGVGAAVGRVKAINYDYGVMQFYVGEDAETANNYNINIGNAEIIIYQKDRNEIEPATIKSLLYDDVVLIRNASYAANAAQIIIIR